MERELIVGQGPAVPTPQDRTGLPSYVICVLSPPPGPSMWQVRHGRQQRDQLQSERGTGFLRQWSPQAPILHLHEGSGSRPWPQNWGDMGLEPVRQLRQAAWGPLEPGCGLPIRPCHIPLAVQPRAGHLNLCHLKTGLLSASVGGSRMKGFSATRSAGTEGVPTRGSVGKRSGSGLLSRPRACHRPATHTGVHDTCHSDEIDTVLPT